MTTRLSARKYLLLGTTLAGAGSLLVPTAAYADCLPDAAGTTVVCNTADPDGFQTLLNGVTIRVEPGALVGTGAATPSPLLSAGTDSVLNNEDTINSGAVAVSLGGGSTVNNAATGSGDIIGDVEFGSTTAGQVSTFNNLGGTASLTGNIISLGALTVNNLTGTTITGDITSDGALTVNNDGGTIGGNITGSGDGDSVSITSGGTVAGLIALGAGDDSFTIGAGTTYTGDVDLADGNNTLTNAGTLTGNVSAAGGDDTATNSGTLTGNIDLGDGDNSITNSGTLVGDIDTGSGDDALANSGGSITGNVNLGDGNNDITNSGAIVGDIDTGAGDDSLANADGTVTGNVNLGAGTDSISDLAGVGMVTKSGSGTLTLSGDNSGFSNAGTVLAVNDGGTVSIGDDDDMFTGDVVLDAGTLQTTGAVTLANAFTLDAGGGTFDTGAATTLSGPITGVGGLTKAGDGNLTLTGVNAYTGGTLISAGTLTGTTISLQGDIVDNASLVFDDAVGGTFAGDISGSGSVTKTNVGTVTFTGLNTYSGATLIDNGTLIVGPSGIGDSSAVTVSDPGILSLAADETIGSLAGTGTVDGGFALTTGGNNGSTVFSGTIDGVDTINKVGTGTFDLTGTGTLVTGFNVDAGTLAIDGTYVTTANTVASGATLNVGEAGDLTGDVAAALGSTAIINGLVTGNVTSDGDLSGTGTVAGALINSGTLSPGNNDIGIFNVDGSFAQTSTGVLEIEITPLDVAGIGYDQLLVTGAPGTAALDGTLAVSLTTGLSAPLGPYVDGNVYDVVDATGGITGDFATVTGNVLSPFITLAPTGIVTIEGAEQAYRLTVDRTDYAVGISPGATSNQIAVATGFQGLVNGATGDAAVLVTSVDAMTAEQARDFFDQASPVAYSAYGLALLRQGELFARQVHLQMHETPNMLPGFDLWGRGYGAWGNGEHDTSDVRTWGFAGGATYRWDSFYAGAAAGWSKAQIDHNELRSNGHNKSWQFGVYGGWQGGPWSADLQVDYIHGSANSTRVIQAPNIDRLADGDTSSHGWKIVATGGYDFDLGSMKLRPFIGIDYTTGKVNSFTETGADALNLSIDNIDAKRTDLMVGLDLKASPEATISPYGRLAYRYNLHNQNGHIHARFNGEDDTDFTVRGESDNKSQIDVDAGVNFQANPNFAVFAGYQGSFRKHASSNGFSAGLSYSFGAATLPPPPPPPPAPPPPPEPPATQTCADGSVILATDMCPAPPPPPPEPPAAIPERG